MGPNRRARERERAATEAAAKAKRAEAERRAVAEAQKVVAIWNARQAGGREPWFYPTIGAAIIAELQWLSFSCPAWCHRCRRGRCGSPRQWFLDGDTGHIYAPNVAGTVNDGRTHRLIS